MLLIRSGSAKARQENIQREIAAGKPPKQAVAIGYAVPRRNKGKNLGDEIRSHLSPSGRLRKHS